MNNKKYVVGAVVAFLVIAGLSVYGHTYWPSVRGFSDVPEERQPAPVTVTASAEPKIVAHPTIDPFPPVKSGGQNIHTPPPPPRSDKVIHTYTDSVSGFSFRYPDTLILVQRDDVCPYLMDDPQNTKSAFLYTLAPSCYPNATSTSYEDFKKDYVEYGEVETKFAVHFVKSEPIKTKSGVTGEHVFFSVLAGDDAYPESQHTYGREKYIFKLPKKGFLVFERPYSDIPASDDPVTMGVVESLTFP